MTVQIVFGMPEADYHATDAMSASAIKTMLEGPGAYWARYVKGWEPPTSTAREIGSLYHTMNLEGPDAFDGRYVTKPVCGEDMLDTGEDMRGWLKAAMPDIPKGALLTATDLKGWLADHDLKKGGSIEELRLRVIENGGGDVILETDPRAAYSTGGSRDDLKARILSHDSDVEFFDDYRVRAIAGREVVSDDIMADLTRAREVLVGSGFGALLEQGEPEVSVFWTRKDASGSEMRCKARLDRLAVIDNRIAEIDYKTFLSRSTAPLEEQLAAKFRFEQIGIQRLWYLEVLGLMRSWPLEFSRADGHDVFSAGQADLRDAIMGAQLTRLFPRSIMVFQRRGAVPLVDAREYCETTPDGIVTRYARRDREDIAWALEKIERYKADDAGDDRPWGPSLRAGVRAFADEDFPAFYLGEGG